MKGFKELGIKKQLLDVIEELGFEEPSEIQERAIPLIVKGRDVIGQAATGSGKTLAFAAGIMARTEPDKGLQALVLTPTRELAEQIARVMRNFSKKIGLWVQEVYGGVGYESQIQGSQRAEIIIATPGRLLDLLEKRSFDFMDLRVLVLDEADRMVDMGFLPDVEKIIGQCPKKRQTLLFSATTSPDITYIANKYMINPRSVTVKKYVDPTKLQHVFYDVDSHMKFSLLVHLLKKEEGIVMVFCNTRQNVDLIAMNLKRHGIHSQAIHGGLDQNKRKKIMQRFHAKEAEILVCTDVAARGLDIKGVTHVYNYDAPKSSDEYIHRVGRTARAGKEGMAISIISKRDYDNFRKVMEDKSLPIEQKEVPKIEQLSARFNKPDFKQGRGRRRDFGKRRGGRERQKQGRGSRPRHKKDQRSRGQGKRRR